MDLRSIISDITEELIEIDNKKNEEMVEIIDKIHRKLIMIVERKFGKERDYLNQLKSLQDMPIGPSIYFTGMSKSSINSRIRQDLIRKRNRYLNLIETILDDIILEERSLKLNDNEINNERSINKRAIFVVHGRNELIRKSIFDFLRSINLEPIEWEEAIKMTTKTNPYIGEILEIAFGKAQAILVIFTPDDLVKLNPRFHKEDDPSYEKKLTGQARPNVLFEAGIGIGKNPERTILVQIGNVKPFSDIAGRYIIKFRGTPQDRRKLTNRLESAGCDVNLDGTDWLTTGDFALPVFKDSDFEKELLNQDKNELMRTKIQGLFDDFADTIIRLYKSKTSTSDIFAQKIHNSLEMKEYFGITAKRPTQPGHSLDDTPIYFLYKLFKLIPNSANLSYDYDRNGKFEKLLDRDSAPDTIKDSLKRVFNKVIEFVKKEFDVDIEFKGDISI